MAELKTKNIIHIKMKAATLLEVIVAMVILMIVFGIGMMVFMNVLRSGYTEREWMASKTLEHIATDTKLNKDYLNNEFKEEGIVIHKTVSKFKEYENLYLIELEAFDETAKSIATHKELMIVDRDE